MGGFNIKKWVARNKKWIRGVVLVLILIFLAELIFAVVKPKNSLIPQIAPPIPSPTPPFTTYKKPVIAKMDRYDIYLLGDSMTHAFGPRGGVFNEILSKAYPGDFFEIWNYAQGGKSILELPALLNEPYQADKDLNLPPVMKGEPELIIIESFGYNPPSQLGREGGLVKQKEILTQVMTTLTNKFPKTQIIFLAAIAPDKKTYAKNISHASPDERWVQAEERIEYITNFIKYAKEHNIPLANAYEASLDADGDGDTKYINPDDNIHPSAEGLALMGRVLTKTIQDENMFPQK